MLEFTYTKANGDVSERKALVISPPRDNYLVADMTGLTDREAHNLTEAVNRLQMKHKEALEEVGVKYRTFIPKQMEIKS